VIGAEPPSPIRGGGILGGVAGGKPKELGEVTAYVLEKAPCRVVVTAPPDGSRAKAAGDGEEGAAKDAAAGKSGETPDGTPG
jgi:APA family basic amino acid/polyamine antiporter